MGPRLIRVTACVPGLLLSENTIVNSSCGHGFALSDASEVRLYKGSPQECTALAKRTGAAGLSATIQPLLSWFAPWGWGWGLLCCVLCWCHCANRMSRVSLLPLGLAGPLVWVAELWCLGDFGAVLGRAGLLELCDEVNDLGSSAGALL